MNKALHKRPERRHTTIDEKFEKKYKNLETALIKTSSSSIKTSGEHQKLVPK